LVDDKKRGAIGEEYGAILETAPVFCTFLAQFVFASATRQSIHWVNTAL
jgi:hypothetical protein